MYIETASKNYLDFFYYYSCSLNLEYKAAGSKNLATMRQKRMCVCVSLGAYSLFWFFDVKIVIVGLLVSLPFSYTPDIVLYICQLVNNLGLVKEENSMFILEK